MPIAWHPVLCDGLVHVRGRDKKIVEVNIDFFVSDDQIQKCFDLKRTINKDV